MSFQILEFIVFELDTGEFYRESWNKGNVNYEIVDKELFYEKMKIIAILLIIILLVYLCQIIKKKRIYSKKIS
jgi:hypothetical protein